MINLRVDKSIRRIIMLRGGESGALQPIILYERSRKKKKQTRALRPAERVAWRIVSAQRAYWDSLAQRHDLSNRKKRDGWVRDGISNMAKATQKGAKQLTKDI